MQTYVWLVKIHRNNYVTTSKYGWQQHLKSTWEEAWQLNEIHQVLAESYQSIAGNHWLAESDFVDSSKEERLLGALVLWVEHHQTP